MMIFILDEATNIFVMIHLHSSTRKPKETFLDLKGTCGNHNVHTYIFSQKRDS